MKEFWNAFLFMFPNKESFNMTTLEAMAGITAAFLVFCLASGLLLLLTCSIVYCLIRYQKLPWNV